MIIRRPKKERTSTVISTCGMILAITGVTVMLLIHYKPEFGRAAFGVAGTICTAAFLVYLALDVLGKQIYRVDQTGITHYPFGRKGQRIAWTTFVAIEEHTVVKQDLGHSRYKAILCTRIPIETVTTRTGFTFVWYSFHLKHGLDVIELVLNDDEYLEFVRCIPQSVIDKGIVKL